MPSSSTALACSCLDARHLAGARHLVAVGGVGEVAQLVLDADQLGAQGDAGLLALEAVGLGGVAQRGRAGQRGGDALDGVGGGLVHGGGDGGLAAAALAPLAQPLAGGQLVAGGALERVGAALERAGALLAGAQGEPQLGLGGAGPAGGQLEPVALVGGGVLALLGGGGLGLGQPRREALELGAVALERDARLGDGPLGAVGLGGRLAHRGTQAAELLGDGGHPGVGLVQRLQRAPRPRRDLAGALAGGTEGEPGALGGGGRGIQRRPRLVDGGLQLEQALAGAAAAAGPAGAEDVAVGGDGGDALAARDQGHGVGGGGHQRDPLEQLLDRGAHRVGGAHDVAGPHGRAVEGRPAGGSLGDAVSPTSSAARPPSWSRRDAMARAAWSALGTASASLAQPRAAATAASWPPVTCSRAATVPTTAWSASAAASRVAAPSLRRRLSSRASMPGGGRRSGRARPRAPG